MTHKRVLSTAARYRGNRYGSLVAVELAGRRSGHSQVWILKCDCGDTIERALDSVQYSLRTTGVAACLTCAPMLRKPPRKGRPLACCPVCAGLPHRRPVNAPCRCGGTYQAESAEPLEHLAVSRKAVAAL